MGRCTLAGCEQARVSTAWTVPHVTRALWLVLLSLCILTPELPSFRAREAHGSFCQVFSSPNITMNIFVIFSPGRKCVHHQHVSMSILLCCNACNDHGLINNSSLSFSWHIPSKESNVLYRTQLNKLNSFIPCKVL